MSMIWSLKKTMVLRNGLYRPADLREALVECLGVQLSLTSVSALVNRQPRALRVRTMQAICNTLNCRLSDFCEIEPDDFARNKPKLPGISPQQLYGGSKSSDGIIFPDPFQFTDEDD